eukprot:UC4_evm2s744
MKQFKSWVNKKAADKRFKKAGPGHSLTDTDRDTASSSANQKNAVRATQPTLEEATAVPPRQVSAAAAAAMSRMSSADSSRAKAEKLSGRMFQQGQDTGAINSTKQETSNSILAGATAVTPTSLCTSASSSKPLAQSSKNPGSLMHAKALNVAKDAEREKTEELRRLSERKERQQNQPTFVEDVRLICPLSGKRLAPGKECREHIVSCLETKLRENPRNATAAVQLIRTANFQSPKSVETCISTLRIYCDNILAKPDDPKYRTIRLANKGFQNRVESCKGGLSFMTAIGFIEANKEGEPHLLILDEDLDVDVLAVARVVLDEVDRPLLGKLDRNIQAFSPPAPGGPAVNPARFRLPSSYYHLSSDELRSISDQRKQVIEKESTLRTKAMREQDANAWKKTYLYALLRVRLPDNYIIQAIFQPKENLGMLREVISSCMDSPDVTFQLQAPSCSGPGNTKLDDLDLATTLEEAGLVPSAVVNLSFVHGGGLNQDILTKARELTI